MGKTTPQVQETSSLEPKDVPFVGWSRAAHEFRVKAATLAPKGILPLLIGDPGVGKRCMARAWRDVAGFGAEIPIIDLDQVAVGIASEVHRIYHSSPGATPCLLPLR